MIEFCSFHPVKKVKSLIGFCSFKFNREFSFQEIPVHKLLIPKGNISIRLLYPENVAPANKNMQQMIDEELNAYIIANYGEIFK